ncbi:MAG TPA: putative Ig domain-containing protein [Geothrix sp.]|nr:putative Ig domain-containing protein [Geothrix sp.]
MLRKPTAFHVRPSASIGLAALALALACGGGGGGGSNPAPPVNHAPSFSSAAPADAKEGHAYVYVISAADADGDSVTLSLAAQPAGAALDAASKTVSWTPTAAQVGTAQAFDVLASDGKGGATHQTWSVTPSANAAPVFGSSAPSSAKEGYVYTYALAVTDADGDAVTLSLAAQPTGAALDATSGTITWTPTSAQAGTAQTFDVLASDGKGGTTHQTWSVTPSPNAAPVFASSAPTTAKEGHAYTYTITVMDADGDAVALALSASPAGAALDAVSRTIAWTPSAAQAGAAQAFDLTASDGRGGTTHQTWSVTPTANAAPAFSSSAPSAAKEGHAYAYAITATDADGDAITLSLPTSPAGAVLDAVGKSIAWTPSAAQIGVVQGFDLVASDGRGGTTHQTWSVTPTANATPAFSGSAPGTAKEGHAYVYSVTATDADGDPLTLTAPTLPAGATFNATSKTVSWTPATAQVGVAQAFDVLASDGLGGTQHQTWSVTPTANAAPAFTSTAPATAKESHPYSYVIAATDADGDPLTLTAPMLPAGATFNATSKTIAWTPATAQVGVAQAFDVLASDGFGGTRHQTWSVTPTANAAPAFTSTAPATAKESHPYNYVIAATDADADPVTLTAPTLPAGATFNATSKTITWTPATAQVGVAQAFDVLASDGLGGTQHQTWSVTPTANAAPAFTSTAPATAKESHPYNYVIAATDADADPVTLTAPTLPAGATFNATSKTISWTPATAQVGVAQAFDVLASDGFGGTQHQTWSVTPTANAAPAFTSTAPTSGSTGTAYTYAAAATDADGDTLTYSLVAKPAWASLSGATVTGTPSASGPMSFTLRADDGYGKTVDQSWSVLVAPAGNQAPTITSTPGTSAAGGVAYTYTVVATDPESDAITYQLTNGPTGAVLTGNSLSWTPSASQERVAASFTIEAQDVWGATSAPQTWTVTPTGTIRGTRFLNSTPMDWYVTGQVSLDPVQDPHAIGALVPSGGGAFTSLTGTFAGDGSYSVSGVPGGSYWLVLGSDNFVWTDKSQVDLGSYAQGRKDLVRAATSTPVGFTLNQMSSWTALDIIQAYDWNTRISQNISQVTGTTNLPNPGDTSLTGMTVNWGDGSFQGGLVDTTKGDHPLITHATRQTVGGQTVYVTKEVYGIGSLIMTDGSGASVNGTFDGTVDATPFQLNLKLSDFTACLAAVSPVATLEDSECVLAGAWDLTRTGLSFGLTVDLVRYSGGTGSTDVNVGPISHVALPAGRLTPMTGVEVSFLRNFQLGATTPVAHRYWVTAYNATLPTDILPITPLVVPVTSLQINGASCVGDITAPAPTEATHTLSWIAPSTGAKGYRVTVYELTAPGAATLETFVAYLYTSSTSIQVPPGLLVSGHTYSICVRALASPSWDPTSAPFGVIESASYGYAETTSGIITMP